ncbi:MAG TPA: T9SS type A sorting domain-containing protein [Candidatus Kapabacteria bacterium]|nr:T9SS type A sorting domain-containing protein [Candidatus Kapabacteria bacterium]
MIASSTILPMLPSAGYAQGVTWERIGQLDFGIQCGYFWNSGTGVVVTGQAQFYYMKDGQSWRAGLKLPYGSLVNSIRCFDGTTLYAPVLYEHVSEELWQSTDSGVTWTQVPANVILNPPAGNNGTDVYWDYRSNAPIMRGTTTARLDSFDIASTSDFFGQGPPPSSTDGGRSWFVGGLANVGPNYNYYSGSGACADRVNKLYYACTESGASGMFRSTDSGKYWTCLPIGGNALPQNLFMMDDVEGIYDKTFLQTSKGMYETTDSGNTWNNIGGPARLVSDDARFFVFGCTGQAVIAFDDGGGIWLANGWDAPSPTQLHSTFSASTKECDSATITITIDKAFERGRFLVTIENDSSGVFELISSDTIAPASGSNQVLVRFHGIDLAKHTAMLSLNSLDYGACPVAHPIWGQAHLLPLAVKAPWPILTCAQVTGEVRITNPNCEPLHITLDSSNSPDLVPLPFDSVITDTGGLGFICPAIPHPGVRSYPLHIEGYFEPSNTPFDTTVWTTIQDGYVASRLDASAYRLDLGTVPVCSETDTTIILQNFGCDTLFVPLAQDSLGSGWSISPNTDTLRLLPDDIDSIHIYFSSVAPGYYHTRFTYPYLGRSSGTVSFVLGATVLAAPPNVALSDTAFDLGTRTLCENDTILNISLINIGCDSIAFGNYIMDPGASFQLLDASDTILPPNGILHKQIAYQPDSDGLETQILSLHFSRTDGSLASDTSILFRVNITGARKALQSFVSSIDAGQTYVCEERDTFVVIQDTGCDSICVKDSVTPTGFVITRGSSFCLAPGASDTVWLRTQIDTTGGTLVNTALLTVTSDAVPPIAPIALSREIEYPVTWGLHLSPPDSGAAGANVTYQIIQSSVLPPDVTSVDFVLMFHDDLLSLDGVDEPWASISGHYRSADGQAHYMFHVSPVPADSILATIHFTAYQTIAAATMLSLDSIHLSSNLSRPLDCIASINTGQTAFTLLPECGSLELVNFLQTGAVRIDNIDPNPAAGDGHVIVSITSSADAAISGELSIIDAIGRIVSRQSIFIAHGKENFSLGLENLPSGFYAVQLHAAGLASTKEFIKE